LDFKCFTKVNKVFARHIFYGSQISQLSIEQVFLRCFRDPIRVPRTSENYHRVPRIRENRVLRIREIGSLQINARYL